jgi:hypothetical protein
MFGSHDVSYIVFVCHIVTHKCRKSKQLGINVSEASELPVTPSSPVPPPPPQEPQPFPIYNKEEILSLFNNGAQSITQHISTLQSQLNLLQSNLTDTLQQTETLFNKNTVQDESKRPIEPSPPPPPPIDVAEFTSQIENAFNTCMQKFDDELKHKLMSDCDKMTHRVEQLERSILLLTEKTSRPPTTPRTPRNAPTTSSVALDSSIGVEPLPMIQIQPLDLYKLDAKARLEHKMAIVIQRKYRARCARKKFNQFIQDSKENPVMKMIKHRNQIIMEIVKTEKGYVESLQLVIQLYLKPLQEDCKKYGVSRKELMSFLQNVFMNISQIYSLHQLFLLTLESRLQNWPRVLIGDCFLNQAPLFLFYIQYVNGYDKALRELREMKKKNQKFLKFYNENKSHKDAGAQNLESLLIKVIQRLPRYSLLLRELLKSTPSTHVDFENLNQALGRINAITGTVNQKKAEYETNNVVDKMMERNIFSDIVRKDERKERQSVSVNKSELMLEIENSRRDQSTLWLDLFDENNKPRKKFLRETHAHVISTGRDERDIDFQGHLYLFENLLIITKPEQKKIDMLRNNIFNRDSRLVNNASTVFKQVGKAKSAVINKVATASGNHQEVARFVETVLNPDKVVINAVEIVAATETKFELECIVYLDGSNSTIAIPDVAARKMIPKKMYQNEERWIHLQVDNKIIYSISIQRESPVVDPHVEWRKVLYKLMNQEEIDDDETDQDEANKEGNEKMKQLMQTFLKILGEDTTQSPVVVGEKRSSKK